MVIYVEYGLAFNGSLAQIKTYYKFESDMEFARWVGTSFSYEHILHISVLPKPISNGYGSPMIIANLWYMTVISKFLTNMAERSISGISNL